MPGGGGDSGGSGAGGSLSSPIVVVILVLLIGATIFLWKARYIRRHTAYLIVALLVLALVVFSAWIYLHPMTA
jgi:hypothetical protein